MLSRWFGNKKIPELAQQFIAALEHYPACPLPAKGEPFSLSPEQTRENLNAFVESTPHRLNSLKTLAAGFDIFLPDPLTLDSTRNCIVNLHALAGETWQYALDDKISKKDIETIWRTGERSGDYKVLSLVSDIALLIGTIIIKERPAIRWGIDSDEKNTEAGMAFVNRVVLLAPWAGDTESFKVIDIERVVLGKLLNPDSYSERVQNSWLHIMEGACRGGYEGVGVVGAFPEEP